MAAFDVFFAAFAPSVGLAGALEAVEAGALPAVEAGLGAIGVDMSESTGEVAVDDDSRRSE